MTAREATAKTWSAGIGWLFALLAVLFSAGALAQPRQVRFMAIYYGLVALLLLVGGLAVWRASSSRLVPVAPLVARRAKIFQGLLTALVWTLPVLLVAYGCTALVMVGHWPYYAHPDPKQLDLPVLHVLVFLSHYAAAAGTVLWLMCFPFAARALGPLGVRGLTATFVLAIVAIYLLWAENLGGLVEWYFD